MKKKLSIFIVAVLLLCVGVFAACNKPEEKPSIPDPTPGGPTEVEPAPKFELDWSDGEQVDEIFKKDDQWSMVLTVSEANQGVFKVDGPGYNQQGYGGYKMNLSLDTVEYPYLVFDIGKLAARFEAKPEYTEDLMLRTSFAGKAVIDFTQMPKKYTGRKIDFVLVLYLTGADQEIVIDSIAQSKTNPIVSSGEIAFNAGDEAKFMELDNLSLTIADGKGAFTLTDSTKAAGSAEFYMDFDTTKNRYFVTKFAEKSYLGMSLMLSEGGAVELIPEGWHEKDSEYVYDLATLPAAYKGKPVKAYIVMTVLDATQNNVTLDNIGCANDKTPSPVSSTVIDFSVASGKQLYNFNYAEFVKNGDEAHIIPIGTGDPEWNSGWAYINVTIDTSLYRYIVFETGRDSKFLARFTTYNAQGQALLDYDFVPDGTYNNEKIGYDLEKLPAEFKGSQKMIQVRLATVAPGKATIKNIKLASEMPVEQAAERIDFNSGDDALFGGMEFLSLNVANGKGTFTVVENGDMWGTGSARFKLKINAAVKRYFVVKLSQNTDMIMRLNLGGTDYDLVGEASRRPGEVYYDLQRLPQAAWDSIINPRISVYKSAGSAVIDEIYTTDTLPEQLVIADIPNLTSDKFGLFNTEYATTSIADGKITVSLADGGDPDYQTGWTKLHLPVNTDIYRYMYIMVEGGSNLVMRFSKDGDFDLVPDADYADDTLVCYDLYNLAPAMKGRATILNDVKLATRSTAKIQSIVLSNTAPVIPPVDTTPARIDFNDGDEAMFTENDKLTVSVADGKGTFTTDGGDGSAKINFKINAGVNRYMVFDVKSNTNVIARFYDGATDHDFMCEGQRRPGVYYYDLQKLPRELWSSNIKFNLFIYGSAGSIVLDSVYTTSDLPAERELVDFSTVSYVDNDNKYYGFYGEAGTNAKVENNMLTVSTADGGTVNEWNCAVAKVNLLIDTSLYRYLAVTTEANTQLVMRYNYEGRDYDFVRNATYADQTTHYYDLRALHANKTGKPALIDSIQISTANVATISSIKLTNTGMTEEKLALTDASFKNTEAGMTVSVGEDGKITTTVAQDKVVLGTFLDISFDLSKNRFIIFDIDSGILGVRFTYNGNDYNLVPEHNLRTSGKVVVYDLNWLPDDVKNAGKMENVKLFAYWDIPTVINSISLA